MFLWFCGWVRLCVCGGQAERFINICTVRGIKLWDIKKTDGKIYVNIMSESIFALSGIIRKTHIKFRIKERHGLPFLLRRYRGRIAFFPGIITAFAIMGFLSGYVWAIEIDGAYTHTNYEIIRLLRENGIYQGMRKSLVSCEEIEKLIRNTYFDVTWTSSKLSGTKLLVNIKENRVYGDEMEEEKETNPYGYNLVSGKAAVIYSIVTRSGTALVEAGSEVKEGEVLIAGSYDIVGDYEEYIRTEYVEADGDVYGCVTYFFEEAAERKSIKKIYTGREKISFGIRIGDKSLTLLSGGFAKEEVTTTVRQLTVEEDFALPVYIHESLCLEYVEEEYLLSDEQLKEKLEGKLTAFQENLSRKGVQILENDVTIEIGSDGARACGNLRCVEKLGELLLNEPEVITER